MKSAEKNGAPASGNGQAVSNPFDAVFGAFKNMRDAGLDAWAKVMIQCVNSELYAKSTGAMMDWYLTASAPFRRLLEKTTEQTLAQLNMPTRADILSLAERLTNIEMTLDDLGANLESRQPTSARPAATKQTTAAPRSSGEN